MSHRDSESHPGREPDGLGPPGVDPSAVAAALERVRAAVHRWLDRIEEIDASAENRVGEGADPALALRLRESEERRAALQDEIERRDREWDAQLEALEHDRRLLAEAWERLEREQIAALSKVGPGDEPLRSPRPPAAAAPPRREPEADGDVDRAIIRQFEALRRDVRRKAEAGGAPHP